MILELRFDGEKGLANLSAVCTELRDGSPRIQATVRPFPGAENALRWGYPVEFLWEVNGAWRSCREIPEGVRAVSFTPDGESIPNLPEVLEAFADCGAETLHLPNVNAVRHTAATGHVALPRPEQIREAAARATGSVDPSQMQGKRLVVHDYFLWKELRAVFPTEAGERMEFSGCQAGSALAYVDWEGNVYPCDSLPIRLGSLLELPFGEVWKNPIRQEVLRSIRSTPALCGDCSERVGCLGGCRGLAFVAEGSFDCPDPACPVRPESDHPRH